MVHFSHSLKCPLMSCLEGGQLGVGHSFLDSSAPAKASSFRVPRVLSGTSTEATVHFCPQKGDRPHGLQGRGAGRVRGYFGGSCRMIGFSAPATFCGAPCDAAGFAGFGGNSGRMTSGSRPPPTFDGAPCDAAGFDGFGGHVGLMLLMFTLSQKSLLVCSLRSELLDRLAGDQSQHDVEATTDRDHDRQKRRLIGQKVMACHEANYASTQRDDVDPHGFARPDRF